MHTESSNLAASLTSCPPTRGSPRPRAHAGSASKIVFSIAAVVISPFELDRAHASTLDEAEYYIPEAELFIDESMGSRRLRGDWEGNEVVMLTFTDNWTAPSQRIGDVVAHYLAGKTTLMLLHDSPASAHAASIAAQSWQHNDGLDVEILPFAVDTPWIRDYGPLVVHTHDARREWIDTDYGPHRRFDDQIWQRSHEYLPMPAVESPLVFEGGAVASNGEGFCISTLEFFSHNDLWPMGGLEDGQATPAAILGCAQLLLVPALRDDLTEHADMFVQFISPDHIWLAQVDPNEDPEDAARMDAVYQAVLNAGRQLGKRFEITRTQLPRDLRFDYYTSYINALRIADLLLVPSYSSIPADRELKIHAQLEQDFPDLTIVAVEADEIATLGGAVHCMALAADWPRPSASPAVPVEASAS